VSGFRVSVAKDYLNFSAAHFLTIPGHKCEALHGHNYAVSVSVDGSVDPATGFVVDFAVLKRILRPVVDAMDHRVLVAGNNPKLLLREEDGRTAIEYGGGTRFVLPADNVAVVPVTDTTAELLAEYLTREVTRRLAEAGIGGIRAVAVDVEESPGQSGTYRIRLEAP
jgi:6-pyruvoyltetrahydropterin/6-carboxytetrahydropterin synthase